MTFLEGLLIMAIALVGVRHYVDRRNLRKMLDWIAGPLDAPVPDAHGAWGEFVSRMNQRVKYRQKEKNLLENSLEQFQSALEALPDGVVFMDTHRHILWMNKLAVRMLGLLPDRDQGTPIEHLIREPEFVDYILGQNFSEPLIYHPSRRSQACYMIHLIAYGDDRLLLTIRDLTRIEKLENVRRDFVANVSHELKTPLTVISGFIETLQLNHQELDSEKRQRYLDMAMAQAQHMNRLVQDLLTLSSLESRALLVDSSEVAIYPLVQELVEAASLMSKSSHEISIQIPETLKLRGSSSALRSIFSNLINNAFAYTPAGGKISISWDIANDEGCFKVMDTGIGISPVHLPRLSERFYRVDQGRSKDTGGTGLGLAIVKHALDRHQGRLVIHSQENIGSTFEARFPLSSVIV